MVKQAPIMPNFANTTVSMGEGILFLSFNIIVPSGFANAKDAIVEQKGLETDLSFFVSLPPSVLSFSEYKVTCSQESYETCRNMDALSLKSRKLSLY